MGRWKGVDEQCRNRVDYYKVYNYLKTNHLRTKLLKDRIK